MADTTDSTKTEDKTFMTNLHALKVSLPDVGIMLDDLTIDSDYRSSDAEYYEMCDYMHEEFPTRILTLKLYPGNITKLVNYRKNTMASNKTFRTNNKSLWSLRKFLFGANF